MGLQFSNRPRITSNNVWLHFVYIQRFSLSLRTPELMNPKIFNMVYTNKPGNIYITNLQIKKKTRGFVYTFCQLYTVSVNEPLLIFKRNKKKKNRKFNRSISSRWMASFVFIYFCKHGITCKSCILRRFTDC